MSHCVPQETQVEPTQWDTGYSAKKRNELLPHTARMEGTMPSPEKPNPHLCHISK